MQADVAGRHPAQPKKSLKSALKKPLRNSSDGRRSRRRRRLQQLAGYNDGNTEYDSGDEITVVSSSPLLTPTPPTVAVSLVKLYPYLIVIDKILNLLTWNNEDGTLLPSVLLVLSYTGTVCYFEWMTEYFGHILIIVIIWLYSLLDKYVNVTITSYPTLDDIVHVMGRVSHKADLILAPISVLNKQDIRRLLFTVAFFSPVYMIISKIFLTPRHLLLVFGLYVLTYHAPIFKSIRKALWQFKLVRLFIFYVTGLDFGGLTYKNQNPFSKAMEAANLVAKSFTNANRSVEFVYVLFENQRRWLGIGWTSSMLSYERASWTDEFLNRSSEPSSFRLPHIDDADSHRWVWVDTEWQLDRTNDGAIHLDESEPKLTSQPTLNDGFIYYDNTWNNQSSENTFTKYTRRRRWVRTAKLVNTSIEDAPPSKVVDEKENSSGGEVDKVSTHTPDEGTIRERKVSFSELQNVHIIPDDGYIR
ncbi:peroxisome biogenesis protein KNAG_0D03380 [Huiozyma naganishii CBS 8797]|uniref:Peroxin/Ferlin domain-containing protein n=1 Tax=Huiozyma naganishii (strain ATCC MYA-139 / BCRC 22969 / CBS 8797 / KCTC 17520 / NBRC 10181 / NCYC 3082 / Yp74L-3) TaxID=1071383 RepID=J7R5G4_HUIN7|nr:hypothetical protein KNAG_0D03380 [Kazachstania naganishii CBS 8797]CCK70085.1 hypothetical protein KNAG_0D03380 [Kazachstania naganishii CBS 8797]